MHQHRIRLLGGHSQVFHRPVVEQVGHDHIVLSLVHIGIGGTIHYHLNVTFAHHAAHFVHVGNVQLFIAFRHIGEDVCIFTFFGCQLHLMAELPVGTGY